MPADPSVGRHPEAARESIDLCGVWKILPDPRDDAELTVCRGGTPRTARWSQALIPGAFEACIPELDCYEGTVWFSRDTAIPSRWEGRRIALRFEGVNHHCRIWVDGREAGGNDDGFLPFEIDLTGLVRAGSRCRILVRVDNERREPDLPGAFTGWRNQGGILREVSLASTARTWLDSVRVDASATGQLAVTCSVRNESGRLQSCAVRVRVLDSSGSLCAEAVGVPSRIASGAAGVCRVACHAGPVMPWSPRSPALYRAEITLSADAELVDATSVRFGFRSIETREGRLLLNGEPLTLIGWNRHEDSPGRGMARDLETARADIAGMKEAGANFVRLCHYPHHPAELDLCDELGLAVMSEIPLYGWGGAEKSAEADAKVEIARRQLQRMILRDSGHPSIVFWSVSNETDESRAEVVAANRTLVRLARSLDPTRLAVHVSFRWQRDPHFEEDDVACVNFYPAVAAPRTVRGLEGIAEAADDWRHALDALHAACPRKPIMVTEFGFPALRGAVGEGMSLDRQARVIEAELAAFRERPFVCGAAIWCWADHPWPPGIFDNGIGVSPYGVLTRDRHPKPGFDRARQLFRDMAGLPESPRHAVSFEEEASGFPVAMIRPHLRDIPRADLPPGYTLRPVGAGDAGLWTDVERDAEDYFTVDDGLFFRQFGADLTALTWRSFVALEERGTAVGVVSAWHLEDWHGLDWGQIHWLAVRKRSQRRGIGRALLSYALERLAEWHERAVLFTQSGRVVAIRLYLDFGFQPFLEQPGAREVWRRVAAEIPHPALADLR